MSVCVIVPQPQLCCRICLCGKARKDITQCSLKNGKSFIDILLFCLDIKVKDSKISTKLCLKCFKKINDFHEFKTLAQQSDLYLQSLITKDIKEETLEASDDHGVHSVWNCEPYTGSPENFKEECKQSEDPSKSVQEHNVYKHVEDFTGPMPSDIKHDYNETSSVKQKHKTGSLKAMQRRKNVDTSKKLKMIKHKWKDNEKHLKTQDHSNTCKCSKCNVIMTNEQRDTHTVKCHADDGKKECHVCGAIVMKLKAHMRYAHDPNGRRFHCQLCDRKFMSRHTLEHHAAKHDAEKPYQCDVCGKSYSSIYILDSHKRRIHEKERNFVCDYCSKGFFEKSRLRWHIRIHTGDKPYKCLDCDKSFISLQHLRVHSLNHGEKKYHCPVCSKSFFNSGLLYGHRLTHIKEKKFECQHCGKGFHRKEHCKHHERTIHAETRKGIHWHRPATDCVGLASP